MPSLRAFLLPLAMASVMILSNFLLQIVNAQPTQVTTSWIVIESLETLSQAVERLTAKIELQTTALNTLEGKMEMQANSLSKMEASLKRLERKAEVQATELKGSLAKGDWQEPVPLHSTSRTIVARKDNNVEMWCVVRGTPEPEIKWIRENDTLGSERTVVENNGKSLRIKNIQPSDEGTYVCVAANGVGSPASQSVRLQVYGQFSSMIESDSGNLEIETSSTSRLWVIQLQDTTGFRLELDPLISESILVIPEQSPSNSNVESIQITASKNASYEFEGKSLAIVVPPGHERSTISWTGLAPDDSGVASNTKFMNDFNGTVEWESERDGTDKIFWALDLEFGAEVNWTLDAAFVARDQENPCEDVSFSVLQMRPDGNISEIQRTCDGSSEGSLKLEINSQVLLLLHIKSVEPARSKLRVSWTRHDEPMEKNVDGIVVGTYGGPIAITFNSTQTKSISSNYIYGVAFDWNSHRIYYLQDLVGIVRSNLDGTDSEILVPGPSSALFGLTIEPTSGNLYFGNRTSRTIRVCDNNAVKCSTIATSKDLDAVWDLAVHRSKGLLFWSIIGEKVVRANLDGSNATVLLERSVVGIHVDEREDRLYWASNNGIESCDLDGQDIRRVPGVTTYNLGLALDGDNIYYSTYSNKSIRVISKSGRNSRLVTQMSNDVWHIGVFGTRLSNAAWNPCKRSECAHLCVLVTRWSFRCTCPDNQQLDVDGKTCKP